MTNDQIRAELRRAACGGADPWEVDCSAFIETIAYRDHESFFEVDQTTMRLFYLIVAEALE